MTAKVSKKNSFSTLSYQVLWLGSGIRPPRTIPLGPIFTEVGIVRSVAVRNSKTGEVEMEPINTVASSHMARRTFVGNVYLHVKDPSLIGKMSGHVEGSTAFSRYRKIEDSTLQEVVKMIE